MYIFGSVKILNMDTQTRERQLKLTPDEVIQILIDGNNRFIDQNLAKRNLLEQVKYTSGNGQYPHTVVLGCVDSRATAEQIFDQGIGDLFNTRIAGNVVDGDVLGSLEFSCKLAGAKLILVFGHTQCGAVTAACNGAKLGHVSALLDKIMPSVEKIRPSFNDITSSEAVDLAAIENVFNSIREIRNRSSVLREMEAVGEIKIVGAFYHIETGVVDFLS